MYPSTVTFYINNYNFHAFINKPACVSLRITARVSCQVSKTPSPPRCTSSTYVASRGLLTAAATSRTVHIRFWKWAGALLYLNGMWHQQKRPSYVMMPEYFCRCDGIGASWNAAFISSALNTWHPYNVSKVLPTSAAGCVAMVIHVLVWTRLAHAL